MDELEAAELALLEALRQNDRGALEELLADDFLITTAGWIPDPVGKSEWLDAASSEHVLETFELRISDVRRFHEVAVVLCESTQAGTSRGEAWRMRFRYTDVWSRNGERWQLAVRHASGSSQPLAAE